MLMSKSRLEKFLYALYSLDSSDLPKPLSRIEELYSCLVTGEEAPTFEPLSRVEKYLMAILGAYNVDELPNPLSRVEVLLYKLAIGDDNLDGFDTFLSEHEELLAEIIRNGGVGGNIDVEYVLYTLSTEHNTLYNTAEKPVKSAILKGNTLKEITNNLFDGEVEDGDYNIETGEKRDYSNRKRCANKIKINPSTTYTVSGITWYLQYDENGNLLGYSCADNNRLIFTSNENAHYLTFYNVNNESDFFVGLGDTEPLYELVSVQMPVLTTSGKNIFDGDNSMELGAWHKEGTPAETSREIRCKNNFTPFPKGLKNGDVMYIVLSDTAINSNTNMHVYDESKTLVTTLGYGTSPYIEGTNFINGVSTITIHDVSKCKYFSFRAVSTNTECRFAIMVNTSAPYEPFKSNILTTNEEVELRKVGDVQDELNLLTGELTQRIGEVVLDGSDDEQWSVDSPKDNINRYLLRVDNLKGVGSNYSDLIKCDKWRVFKPIQGKTENQEGIYINGWSCKIHMGVDVSRLSENSLNGFKQWLSKNPLTVQFLLGQEVVKTVDLSTVNQDGNNTKLSTFNDITHVTLSSEGLIPEAELEVATKNEEDLEDSVVYAVHTLSTEFNTLYNTAEKPVKSAILKGNTLVNLINLENFTSSNGLYTCELPVTNNTTYTVIATLRGSDKIYPSTESVFRIKANDANGEDLISMQQIEASDISTILNLCQTIKITTQNNLHIRLYNTLPENLKIIILEGDHTQEDIPYFEGMQSVKMPVLTTSNVIQRVEFETMNEINLYDGSMVSIDSKGTVPGGCIEYFDISKLTNAKFVFKTTQSFERENYFTFFFYDKDKTFIKWLNGGLTKIADGLYSSTIPTVENAKYLRVVKYDFDPQMFNIIENSISAFVDNSLSIDSTFSIKSNILTVNEEVELRGIGDVKDELDLLTGEVTERVGEIVLDGSENWKTFSTQNGTYRYATTDKMVNVLSPSNDGGLIKALSNSLPITSAALSWRNTVGISNHKTNGWFVYEGTHNDLTGFKEWLSQNPITVQYQLATESIKTVDLSVVDQDGNSTKLSTFDDITHVILSSEELIPEAELEVAEKVTEVAANMLGISREQEVINTATNEQSENVDSTMIATTEIYEELL